MVHHSTRDKHCNEGADYLKKCLQKNEDNEIAADSEVTVNDKVSVNCEVPEKQKNNICCVTGFIFSILGIWFYWLYCIFPIMGIVFSACGLHTIDESEKGKNLGKWGLGIGIFYTFLYMSKSIFLGAV